MNRCGKMSDILLSKTLNYRVIFIPDSIKGETDVNGYIFINIEKSSKKLTPVCEEVWWMVCVEG